MKKEMLCNSVGNYQCFKLIISDPKYLKKNAKKPIKAVILSARVHPGETVASWMMRGSIFFLTSEDLVAKTLRENFYFIVLPMLNPDGVVQGNYRTSLVGCDLNRKYQNATKVLHPSIYYYKKLCREISEIMPIALICDYHGHSRKQNIFMYGNTDDDKPEEYCVFPYIVSQLCDFFSFKDSRFGVQKSKLSTARIALWKLVNIPNVFTIEASFYCANQGKNNGKHFTNEDLMYMGKMLCEGLISLNKITINCSNVGGNAPTELPVALPNLESALEEVKKELHKVIETQSDSDDNGSDSNPSEDDIPSTANILCMISKELEKKDTPEDTQAQPKDAKKQANVKVNKKSKSVPKNKHYDNKKVESFKKMYMFMLETHLESLRKLEGLRLLTL